LLESLISSKTRIKLLLRFFLNPGTQAYLREISNEFGESTNSIRIELNRLTKAKLLTVEPDGRTLEYSANTEHPLFSDIVNIVKKYVGFDHLLKIFFRELKSVHLAFISGDYAKGIDSGLIDVIFVGNIETGFLDKATSKVEKLINRKVRTLVLSTEEYELLVDRFFASNVLLLWGGDNSKGKKN
jgi:hypothetical protein